MEETVFNIFYFISEKESEIVELGVVAHVLNGSDEEKLELLKRNIESDSIACTRFPLPKKLQQNNGRMSATYYNAMMRLGRSIELFEDIFTKLQAPEHVLYIATPITNDKITFDIQDGHDSLLLEKHQGHPKLGAGIMSDYLEQYVSNGVLDISSLIHNDHYTAIKLLFNNGHYLSSMKLLVSFIDTMGYLDFGENGNVFVLWLKKYASLSELDVTEEEMWEFRNSILHMTNLDSRKVMQGKIDRISFTIAPTGTKTFSDHDTKYFNYPDFIKILQNALGNWLTSYKEDSDKLIDFIKRYDRIIADSRYAKLSN